MTKIDRKLKREFSILEFTQFDPGQYKSVSLELHQTSLGAMLGKLGFFGRMTTLEGEHGAKEITDAVAVANAACSAFDILPFLLL